MQHKYLWFEVAVAHALVVTVLDTVQQLLEEKLGCFLPRAAVDLDAVKQLSTVGQLHHEEDRALGLLRELQHAIQMNHIPVMHDFSHVANFPENSFAAAHEVGILRWDDGNVRARSIAGLHQFQVLVGGFVFRDAGGIRAPNVDALIE